MFQVNKKTIVAKNYVNTLIRNVLTTPSQAAREARIEVDFSNFSDVTRYRANVEAIIWSNVQIAARLIETCLWIPGLIDKDTNDLIWGRLSENADFFIREALTTVEEADCENQSGPLQKPICDICRKEGGRLKAGHHRICERCMDEVVQIVFARATEPD